MKEKTTQTKKNIPKGWKEVRLGDVIEKIIDYRGKTPKKLGGDWCSKGYRAISARSIKNGKLVNEDKMNLLSEDLYRKWMKDEIQFGDIILTSEAPLGEHLIWKSNEKIVLSQRVFAIRTNRKILNPFYFNHFIDSRYFQHELKSRQSGTTVTGIRQTELLKTKILLPPLSEQKAIAEVLSSLDDKIDLLHRQNKTLENIAQALFRKWFIDEADDGWEERSFVDFFDFLEGPGIRNWQYTESGTRFINIRLIQNGEIKTEKANFVSDQEANGKYKHFLLKEKDMIVSTSGTLGKTAIIRKYHLPLMLNTSVIRFRPKDGVNYSFVYQYLQSKQFREDLENYGGGSVQKNFGPTHLRMMKFRLPPAKLLENFRRHADNLYIKLDKNYLQIRTLENLRDILLPKLMGGELRVRF